MQVKIKRQGQGLPSLKKLRQPPSPYDDRIGEKGRVKALHSEDNTVDVLLDSGTFLKHVQVRSNSWVIYKEDTDKDYNSGGRDLPPLHTRVFVLMPTKTYSDCFVLCSLFSTPSETDPFLAKDRERIEEVISPSWWHTTNDNDTGTHSSISPDKKTSFLLDYGSIKEPLDPSELHFKIFHDEENDDPGIKFDFVSGKTISTTMFNEVIYTHEKEDRISLEEKLDKYFKNWKSVYTDIDEDQETRVAKNSLHESNNTDIHSNRPIGIKGTETQLGGDVLQVFWQDLIKAVSQYPIFIPPVRWPKYVPVPPVPIIINMALVGITREIVIISLKAKANCAKALK